MNTTSAFAKLVPPLKLRLHEDGRQVLISYRQKDNKYDGWVTEFVNNLKGEPEVTFKEEVSIYYDINYFEGQHNNITTIQLT